MKKLIACLAFAALASPAMANEVTASCEAYVAEHGGDPSGCGCLGDAAAGDAALADALMAIDTPEALEAADDSTKEAIAACFPDSDAV